MNVVAVAKSVVAISQIAQEVVQHVEDTNGAQSGAAKAQLAVDVIGTIYSATEFNNVIPFSSLMTQAGAVVNAVVAFYNTIGLFKKKVAVPQAA